jgi:ABC-type antimicrobial peptide transport system permease subunit
MDLYNKDRLDFISFKSAGLSMNEGTRRVRDLFRDNHKISNPANDLAKDDFRVLTQADAIKNAGVIGMILQILLASIAAISLIVAGIGIMNIMFVTVTERTAEIGLRKAIGAKPKDILNQFLTEALLLTFGGGLLGVILGVSSSYLMLRIIGSYQEGWTFAFPTRGVVMAFSVSAVIGVIFGYFPARRAAKLNPIEALRYE